MTPLKRGQWPKDPAEAERELRARFGEILDAVEGMRARHGPRATIKIVALVNVHGDERGLVDDDMRAQPCAIDADLAPVVAPQTYRGKKR